MISVSNQWAATVCKHKIPLILYLKKTSCILAMDTHFGTLNPFCVQGLWSVACSSSRARSREPVLLCCVVPSLPFGCGVTIPPWTFNKDVQLCSSAALRYAKHTRMQSPALFPCLVLKSPGNAHPLKLQSPSAPTPAPGARAAAACMVPVKGLLKRGSSLVSMRHFKHTVYVFQRRRVLCEQK